MEIRGSPSPAAVVDHTLLRRRSGHGPVGGHGQVLCLFVRNCLVGTAPIYLRELCVPVSTDFYRQSLRSAACGDLMIPKFRIGHGKRGFAVAAPTLWNSLPLSVRRLYDQPAAFKRELKTFMFNLQSPAPLRISSLGALYK